LFEMTMSYPDFKVDTAIAHAPRAVAPSYAQASTVGLYRRGLKRLFDACVVVCAAPVVAPIVVGLAVAIALDGGKPFYTQSRIGLNGKTFRMWKLRSMVRDADAKLEGHLASNPAARAEWDEVQKLKDDPRITRLGRFLRRSSADELPQLWNVLNGTMSLVGPRPMMLNQKDLYPGEAYYRVRPGITGLWQTAGRNRTSFCARAEFDATYEESVTFRTDIGILWRTVAVVLRGTGC
jgi:exopolysaccharide production protein ExoY